MLLPRVPQGGRWPQMKADLKLLAEAAQSLQIQPGVGTFVVQSTPAGTIVRARPTAEEVESSGEPIWL